MDKERLLLRIFTGVLRCQLCKADYSIQSPSLSVLIDADRIYERLLRSQTFNEYWFKRKELEPLLRHLKLIEGNLDDIVEAQRESHDDLKVEMYLNYTNPKVMKTLDKRMQLLNIKMSETFTTQHMFDHVTAEGYAEMMKEYYVLYWTLYDDDNKERVFSCNFECADYIFLDDVLHIVRQHTIIAEEMRELARTDPWRSYWSASKDNVFGKPAIALTEEQRLLIGYSRMYDNIFSSPECPPDEVVNNDYVLDGWMIHMNRERDKLRDEKGQTKTIGKKHVGAGEVFFPADSQIDLDKINKLNSVQSTIVKKQRDIVLKNKGVLKEAELPDVKQNIQLQRNRGAFNRGK